MYGLITRLTAHAGRRDELGLCLLDPNVKRPGCHSYVLAQDPKDADALCPDLPPGVRVLPLPGDHHFNGDHDRLAREILNAAAR